MPVILTDNFNDASIDTAKWDVNAIADLNAGVTVVETTVLTITPLSSTAGSNRNGLISDSTFDLTKGFAIWKLQQIAGPVANAVTRCGVYLDANNYLSFEVANTTLTFRKRAASVNSDTTATYNSTNHKYLMLHHCGAIVNWYTSADGVTWAAQRTAVAPGFAVTAVKMFLDAGTIASVVTPGTAIFDDVEIGTLDFPLPFEQLAAFERKVDLIIDPGFPLNLVPVEAIPFTIPMPKQRSGSRIFATGTILQYKATCAGEIDTFDIWLNSANASATSAIFNLKINGIAVFAGVARPTFTTGLSHVQKTSVGYAVELGDDVEITVEQCPLEGISGSMDTLARVVVG